ncbi:hypothetical protein EYF80_021368 [Liparis tanakae]|uniref:Uncharacterized protein n=1 Tax=Liparis tanakae TaxID=230148 RepID=A0A4Z2HRV8_9TELE|nr:hypothetical protein EYF80_021368 [Liparis tanakae]
MQRSAAVESVPEASRPIRLANGITLTEDETWTYLLYNGVIVIPAGHIDVDRLEGERKQEQQIPQTQPDHLQRRKYVMRQLQTALSQGHDGLQLSAQRSSLQVQHGRVLIPRLVLLAEATPFMVPHQRQVDLVQEKADPGFIQQIKFTLNTSFQQTQA